MAALPYMQLYVADYLADTAHLTAIQHGGYLLLLMNYWQRGKALVNSNVRLANVARMSNEEWNENRDVLAEFFIVTDDEWIHNRVEFDLEKVRSKSNQAVAAGKASGATRRKNKKRTVVRTDVQANVATDANTDVPTDDERNANHTEADTDTEAEEKKTTTLALTSLEVTAGVFELPLPGTQGNYQLTQKLYDELQRAFPELSIMAQLEQARIWLITNPKRMKTAKGMPAFIRNWLDRAQNQARPTGAPHGNPAANKQQQREHDVAEAFRNAFTPSSKSVGLPDGREAGNSDRADIEGFLLPTHV